MRNATLLEAVCEAARVAGSHALARYGKDVTVRTKTDGSAVSDADVGAEEAVRAWIGERFPDDGIVGEELGTTGADRKRRWIVDPIDGTTSYLRRVPLWGTLVAVAEADTVLAGAIYCPAVDEMVGAAAGEGCWWNGARARVSDVAELSDATVLTSAATHADDEERGGRWRALAAKARVARTWGDCYGYLLVATGRAEVMADPVLKPWDSAALAPVIAEAGGVFTDWSGRATGLGGSAIASNARLARACRALLEAGEP